MFCWVSFGWAGWNGDRVKMFWFEEERLIRRSLLGGRAARRGRDMCILSAR